MGIEEIVAAWLREGELATELSQLQQILERRKYTRQQIDYCFELMLTGAAIWANELTLTALKKTLIDVFSDEVRTIEICGELVDAQGKPEVELLEDIERGAANKLWQRQAPEK